MILAGDRMMATTKNRIWSLLGIIGVGTNASAGLRAGLPRLTRRGAALLEEVRRTPLDQSDAALEKLDAAIREAGSDAARLSIAKSNRLEALGRHEEAGRIALATLKAHPDCLLALEDVADFRMYTGDFERARRT